MSAHKPRYGMYIYAVKVSREVNPKQIIYVGADSVTVSGGALMFAAEVHPVEAFADDDTATDGDIELPPVAVIAAGQWYTVTLVDHDLTPIFVGRQGG